MRIFLISEARQFCSQFIGLHGKSEGSLLEFYRLNLENKVSQLNEGTPIFNEYRDCLLRDVERNLFFSVSNYRRSLDLMLPSSSHWAHVTSYYASFYCAKAFLGIFGGAIFEKVVIDVQNGTPGQQSLKIRKIGNRSGQISSTYNGSHRRFWDFFYRAVVQLRPMVSPALSRCLTPIGGDKVWQIGMRNEINYDSWLGLNLVSNFLNSFDKRTFPNSLPGVLSTQYGIVENMLELSFLFVKQFGLNTDSLNRLSNIHNISGKINDLIYNTKAPGLVSKTKKNTII